MVSRRRRWRAENQDISICRELGPNKFLVSGSKGKRYRVDLSAPSCECPDWRKRSPSGGCKHIIKVKLDQGMLDQLPSAKTNYGSPSSRSQSEYPSNWKSLSRRTKERDNWTCQRCGAEGGKFGTATLNAHHIIPKSKGGRDSVNNLITLCVDCHEEEHGHSIPQQHTGSSSPSISHGTSTDGSHTDGTRNRKGATEGTNSVKKETTNPTQNNSKSNVVYNEHLEPTEEISGEVNSNGHSSPGRSTSTTENDEVYSEEKNIAALATLIGLIFNSFFALLALGSTIGYIIPFNGYTIIFTYLTTFLIQMYIIVSWETYPVLITTMPGLVGNLFRKMGWVSS